METTTEAPAPRPASTPASMSVAEAIDGAAITPTHLLIFAVCLLTSLVDGFDTQMVGFTAGSITHDLHFGLAAFGTIFAAAAAGSLLGAPALGALADRAGRKPSLIVSTTLFAVPTLLTLQAGSAREFMTLRFVAGVGLGGAMPGVLTLVSEYAPLRHRGLATGLLWCGYPCGGLLAGGLGSVLLPAFGWRSVFLVGGALATTAILLQILLLPESLRFLAGRVDGAARMASTLSRLAPGKHIDMSSGRRQALKVPLAEVFASGRRLVTVLLWVPLVCTFFIAGFFVLWLRRSFSRWDTERRPWRFWSRSTILRRHLARASPGG